MAANGTPSRSGVAGTKRKRFPHGNYTGYYATRYGLSERTSASTLQDPRLDLLQSEWFEGKKCLDIGCNEGDLTLALVLRFRPCRMVGLDIDGKLVDHARKALEAHIREAVASVKRREHERDEASKRESCPDKDMNGPARSTEMLAPTQSLKAPSGAHAAGSETGAGAGTCFRESTVCDQDGDRLRSNLFFGYDRSGSLDAGFPVRAGRAVDDIKELACNSKEVACNPQVDGPSRCDTAKHAKSVLDDAEEENAKKSDRDPERSQPPLGFDGRQAVDDQRTSSEPEDQAPTAFGPRGMVLAGCKVSFQREDFTTGPHSLHGYDVVSLFSVVKWIHLNGGDDAIRRVFRKAYALLKPGGRLIVEPQPWKSYTKSARQHGTARARAHVSTIKLRPTDFPSLLTDEIGFRSWEEVGSPGKGVGAFAHRSLHVFIK